MWIVGKRVAGLTRLSVFKAAPAGWEGWKETHMPVLLPHSLLKVGPLWRRDSPKPLPELLEDLKGWGDPDQVTQLRVAAGLL